MVGVMGDDRKFQRLTFEKCAVLLEEGKTSEAAYVIREGRVEIRIGTLTTNPRTLGSVGKGEVVGELALFDNHPHVASVVAAEKTVVTAISGDAFRKMLEGMDPVIKGVVNMLVKRFRRVTAELMLKQNAGIGDVAWGPWRRK